MPAATLATNSGPIGRPRRSSCSSSRAARRLDRRNASSLAIFSTWAVCSATQYVLALGEPGTGLGDLQAALLTEADETYLEAGLRGDRALMARLLEAIRTRQVKGVNWEWRRGGRRDEEFFRGADNVGDMLEGFATVKRLATSPRHVIPGHDPLVLRRYPAPKPELEGIAARLDVEPAE